MQQQHAREYRYAQVVQQQWAAAMPAWDGYGDSSYDDRAVWREYRPLQDEDTLDSEELSELLAGIPTGLDIGAADPDSSPDPSPDRSPDPSTGSSGSTGGSSTGSSE